MAEVMAGRKSPSVQTQEVQGIWANKRLLGVDTMTDREIVKKILKKVKQTSFMVQRDKNRVGNDEGHSFLNDMESLKNRFTKMEADHNRELRRHAEELQKHTREFHEEKKKLQASDEQTIKVRASELEWLNDSYDHTARLERNEIVHRADIQIDLKALKYLEITNPNRFKSACKGFEYLHSLSWENRAGIENFPQDVAEIAVIRGNMTTLTRWKTPDADSTVTAIVSLCDTIVKKQLESHNGGNAYMYAAMKADCNNVKEHYQKACKVFC
ncbi:hypothetical protein PISL3812_07430 [Talaromyces islandicus]|uniref:Uncharacterized protein n=1 Tax=Talaromyces islandicus TaxID=28573 RepID=A0A0U1M613_TALIS|nr:hypothetical protein PISL3812_07430 [Talaromyces islandicus]